MGWEKRQPQKTSNKTPDPIVPWGQSVPPPPQTKLGLFAKGFFIAKQSRNRHSIMKDQPFPNKDTYEPLGQPRGEQMYALRPEEEQERPRNPSPCHSSRVCNPNWKAHRFCKAPFYRVNCPHRRSPLALTHQKHRVPSPCLKVSKPG